MDSDLCTLSELTMFSIYANQIGGEIPESIGNLINLQFIDLSFNQLTGSIPLEIGNLIKLTDLNLILHKNVCII